MGNKPNLKVGKNTLIRRTNFLITELERLKRLVDYNHRLINEFIIFKGDVDSFKQFVEEKSNAINKESRELHKGTETNKKVREGKQGVENEVKQDKESTPDKKVPETAGESGNIGV
jgi:FKBP-type peptidyl-prolyl cis-trans isomerase 2